MNMQLIHRQMQGQSLVMTSVMQQAISLLQLSNMDLQRYIEKEAEENPFIGVNQRHRAVPSLPYSDGGQANQDDPIARIESQPLSLYGHVSAQFDILFPDPTDRAMADRFLEALETNGWLADPLDEIAADCGLDDKAAEEMLYAIQQVEPAGLFARSLAECLALQAEDQGLMTPLFRKVLDNLPRLAAADLAGLARACGCGLDDLRAPLKQLRSLNPKPGADFVVNDVSEREPDLIVIRGETGWVVELNRSTLPAVEVDETLLQSKLAASSTGSYVGERLGVARWLRHAVEHRNQTTLASFGGIIGSGIFVGIGYGTRFRGLFRGRPRGLAWLGAGDGFGGSTGGRRGGCGSVIGQHPRQRELQVGQALDDGIPGLLVVLLYRVRKAAQHLRIQRVCPVGLGLRCRCLKRGLHCRFEPRKGCILFGL